MRASSSAVSRASLFHQARRRSRRLTPTRYRTRLAVTARLRGGSVGGLHVAGDQGVRQTPLEAHDLSPVSLKARLAGAAGTQFLTARHQRSELALQRIARPSAAPPSPVAKILERRRTHLSCDDEANAWFVENA